MIGVAKRQRMEILHSFCGDELSSNKLSNMSGRSLPIDGFPGDDKHAVEK